MLDFNYYTPTNVHFGRNAEEKIGPVLKGAGATKVLIHYGSERVQKSGLIGKIEKSLDESDIAHISLGGVEPNPKISLVRKGIELCKVEKVDYLLAVGGGSAIDSTKSISLGLAMGRDPWELICGQIMPDKHFPFAVVSTMAAAGSEMSNSHVISDGEQKQKKSLNHDLLRPDFAFMNPENTYTTPPFETACGIVDIMMHTIERYLTEQRDTDLTDRLSEALLKSVKIAGEVVMRNPEDYEARATLLWASALSHNGLTGCGKVQKFSVHKIGHAFSGVFDRIAHGAGLSVLFPAWAKYIYRYDVRKFARLATEVFDVPYDYDNPEKTAANGIEVMKTFFASLGMPVTMSDLGLTSADYETIVNVTTVNGTVTVPSYKPLTKEDILNIYKLAES